MDNFSELIKYLSKEFCGKIPEVLKSTFIDCALDPAAEIAPAHLVKAISLLLDCPPKPNPWQYANPDLYTLAVEQHTWINEQCRQLANPLLDDLFPHAAPLDEDEKKQLGRLFHLGSPIPREKPTEETKVAIKILQRLSEVCSEASLRQVFKDSLADVVNNFERHQDAERYSRIQDGFDELGFVKRHRSDTITPVSLRTISDPSTTAHRAVGKSFLNFAREKRSNKSKARAKNQDEVQLQLLHEDLLKQAAEKPCFESRVRALSYMYCIDDLTVDREKIYRKFILNSTLPNSARNAISVFHENFRGWITDNLEMSIDILEKITFLKGNAGKFASAVAKWNQKYGAVTPENVGAIFKATQRENADDLAGALCILTTCLEDPDAYYRRKVVDAKTKKPSDFVAALITAAGKKVHLTPHHLDLLAKSDSPGHLLEAIQITSEFASQLRCFGFKNPDGLLTIQPAEAALHLAKIIKLLSETGLEKEGVVTRHFIRELCRAGIVSGVDTFKGPITELHSRSQTFEKIYARLEELRADDLQMHFFKINPAGALETRFLWWNNHYRRVIKIMELLVALGVEKKDIDYLWLITAVTPADQQKESELKNLPASLIVILHCMKFSKLSDDGKKETGEKLINMRDPQRVKCIRDVALHLPPSQCPDLVNSAMMALRAGLLILAKLLNLGWRLELNNSEFTQDLVSSACALERLMEKASADNHPKFGELFRIILAFQAAIIGPALDPEEKEKLQRIFRELVDDLPKMPRGEKGLTDISADDLLKLVNKRLARVTATHRIAKDRQTTHNTVVNRECALTQIKLLELFGKKDPATGKKIVTDAQKAAFVTKVNAITEGLSNQFHRRIVGDYLNQLLKNESEKQQSPLLAPLFSGADKNQITGVSTLNTLILLFEAEPYMGDPKDLTKLITELAIYTQRGNNKGIETPEAGNEEDLKDSPICVTGARNKMLEMFSFLHKLEKACEEYEGGPEEFKRVVAQKVREAGFGEEVVANLGGSEYLVEFKSKSKETATVSLQDSIQSSVSKQLIQLAETASSQDQIKFVIRQLHQVTKHNCDYQTLLDGPDAELLPALQAGQPSTSPWYTIPRRDTIFALFIEEFGELFKFEDHQELKENMTYAPDMLPNDKNSLIKNVEEILSKSCAYWLYQKGKEAEKAYKQNELRFTAEDKRLCHKLSGHLEAVKKAAGESKNWNSLREKIEQITPIEKQESKTDAGLESIAQCLRYYFNCSIGNINGTNSLNDFSPDPYMDAAYLDWEARLHTKIAEEHKPKRTRPITRFTVKIAAKKIIANSTPSCQTPATPDVENVLDAYRALGQGTNLTEQDLSSIDEMADDLLAFYEQKCAPKLSFCPTTVSTEQLVRFLVKGVSKALLGIDRYKLPDNNEFKVAVRLVIREAFEIDETATLETVEHILRRIGKISWTLSSEEAEYLHRVIGTAGPGDINFFYDVIRYLDDRGGGLSCDSFRLACKTCLVLRELSPALSNGERERLVSSIIRISRLSGSEDLQLELIEVTAAAYHLIALCNSKDLDAKDIEIDTLNQAVRVNNLEGKQRSGKSCSRDEVFSETDIEYILSAKHPEKTAAAEIRLSDREMFAGLTEDERAEIIPKIKDAIRRSDKPLDLLIASERILAVHNRALAEATGPESPEQAKFRRQIVIKDLNAVLMASAEPRKRQCSFFFQDEASHASGEWSVKNKKQLSPASSEDEAVQENSLRDRICRMSID